MSDFGTWLEQLELLEPTLSPTELRFAGLLGRHLDSWVPDSALRGQLRHEPDPDLAFYDGADVRTFIWRLRRKLHPTPWRIQNRPGHRMYRLVHHA